MQSDPIKAALVVAGQELATRQHDDMEYREAASIAIAAFLDALPLYSDMPMGKDRMGFFDAATRAHWAAAVRRAAGGE